MSTARYKCPACGSSKRTHICFFGGGGKAKKVQEDAALPMSAEQLAVYSIKKLAEIYEVGEDQAAVLYVEMRSLARGDFFRDHKVAIAAQVELPEAAHYSTNPWVTGVIVVLTLFCFFGFMAVGKRLANDEGLIRNGNVTLSQRLEKLEKATTEGTVPWTVPNISPSGSGMVTGPPVTSGSLTLLNRTTHRLELMTRRPCWLRVTADEGGNEYTTEYEGTTTQDWEMPIIFSGHAHVKDGCPGDVSFNLDGEPVTTKNLSLHPKNTEMVDLP